jgi:S1-C subfamily serine protease
VIPAVAIPAAHAIDKSVGLELADWGQQGAAIVSIAPDSPADLAGFHVGDVISVVNGKRVRSAADFQSAMSKRAAGSRFVTLGYMFQSNLGWMPGADKVLKLSQ